MIARALFTAFLLAANLPATAGDWPWWRGPGHDGAAASDAAPPTAFGEDQGILWSVAIPGRGHGSACVAGDRVYLATADEETQIQAMHGFDRATGKLLWTTTIHENGLTQKINKKASWASVTPACDGERIYINFLSGDAVTTTALDLDGKFTFTAGVAHADTWAAGRDLTKGDDIMRGAWREAFTSQEC